MAEFAFDCACGKRHEGSPHAVLKAPDAFTAQSEEIRAADLDGQERAGEMKLADDVAVVAEVAAELARGTDSYFVWNLWVRLAQEDYERYLKVYEKADSLDEFLSALSNALPFYLSTDGMPIKIKRQPGNVLPLVTVAMMDHELAVDCRDGLLPENAARMAAAVCPEAIRQAQAAPPPATPPSPENLARNAAAASDSTAAGSAST